MKENLLMGILLFARKFLKVNFTDPFDHWISQSDVVVHVGAHLGQERISYLRHGVTVYWLEANPRVFGQLQKRLRNIPNQYALNSLVDSKQGIRREFRISNFGGQSSSFLEMDLHLEVWPDIKFVETFEIISESLNSIIDSGKITLGKHNLLILDTQGSELMVLKGASKYLSNFNYIITEAANFSLYAGGCTADDLQEFLGRSGFSLEAKIEIPAWSLPKQGGSQYEMIFSRITETPKESYVFEGDRIRRF